jgi:hypothetical protein
VSTGGRWKYETVEELEAAVEEYVSSRKPTKLLDDQGNVVRNPNGQPVWVRQPPTITGLALALGFKDRKSFYEQEARGDGFARALARARSLIEEHHEARLSEAGSTGSIFFLKNHGWIDEQTVSGGERPVGIALTAITADEAARFREAYAAMFGAGGAAGR